MTAGLIIRPEQPDDVQTIYTVTARAFATQSHADGDEQDLVDLLRERGELVLSLVAILPKAGLDGHIGFSPATIDRQECGWFQMAPVSVEPAFHNRGIGSKLIMAGIEQLREQSAQGIGVLGSPAYYERFGFQHISGLAPNGPEALYFRAMSFEGPQPQGVIGYASAFG